MHVPSILLLGLVLLTQACSYAISRDTASRADRSLAFQKLSAEPRTHIGKIVILGGEIIDAQHVKNGTLIEVIQRELDYWDKPRRTNRSGGRFLILHRARLDDMVYAAGREITVAGEVAVRGQSGPDVDPSIPFFLHVRELKLWPKERLTSDKPQWLDPLHDPRSSQGTYGY